jgi:hypothetical protein
MRRTVDPAAFAGRRVVVQFEYPDAPKGAQNWWLVTDHGEMDLCLNDPDYEVDVVLKSPLKTMTEIWLCKKAFYDAVRKNENEIEVAGNSKPISELQHWLRSNKLANLAALEELPKLAWNSG